MIFTFLTWCVDNLFRPIITRMYGRVPGLADFFISCFILILVFRLIGSLPTSFGFSRNSKKDD